MASIALICGSTLGALTGLLGWLVFNDAVPIGQIYALVAPMGVVAGVNISLSQAYF